MLDDAVSVNPGGSCDAPHGVLREIRVTLRESAFSSRLCSACSHMRARNAASSATSP